MMKEHEKFWRKKQSGLRVCLDWTLYEKKYGQGKILERTHQIPRSYLLGMADLLYVQMSQASQIIKDGGGVNQAVVPVSTQFNVNVAAGSVNGIAVGTGVTAVTIADFALGTIIAHGVGVGQLQYGATTVNAPTTVGSTRQFTITRTFSNASGGSITVTEVGFNSVATFGIYVERVLSTRLILNGASAMATYTIGVTV